MFTVCSRKRKKSSLVLCSFFFVWIFFHTFTVFYSSDPELQSEFVSKFRVDTVAKVKTKKRWDPGESLLRKLNVIESPEVRDSQQEVGSLKPWQLFGKYINNEEMYSESAPYLHKLLKHLSTEKIAKASIYEGGSQVKFLFEFDDGNQAIAKPMRHERTMVYEYNEAQPFWLDEERHTAEIAAFHLDRILNFRRVPPCVGRIVNFTSEILLRTTDQNLLNTTFTKDGNVCFIGKCAPWFCNDEHPICAKGHLLEVSICQFVPKPASARYAVSEWAYPWSQGIKESKVWKNENVCNDMLKTPITARGRFFLDLMDQGLFDFLIVNYDRHHFMTLTINNEGFVGYMDNGKGFGNPYKDDVTFLAPIYQCCRIRPATYKSVVELTSEGTKLGDLMRMSLSQDPIAPILLDSHFESLDRRLLKALEVINTCIQNLGNKTVLVDHITVTLNAGR